MCSADHASPFCTFPGGVFFFPFVIQSAYSDIFLLVFLSFFFPIVFQWLSGSVSFYEVWVSFLKWVLISFCFSVVSLRALTWPGVNVCCLKCVFFFLLIDYMLAPLYCWWFCFSVVWLSLVVWHFLCHSVSPFWYFSLGLPFSLFPKVFQWSSGSPNSVFLRWLTS